MDDNTKVWFGKYRDKKTLGELSNGYLQTLYDRQKEDMSPALKEYIIQRVPVLRATVGRKDPDREDNQQAD